MALEISDKLNVAGVMAVLVIDRIEHTLPTIESLLEGGVGAIELTLRTPIAWEAARLIKKTFPEVLLGLGTVLTTDQVRKAVDWGVDFAVAPGCNPKVIAEAHQQGLFFGPGVMTPTDIEMALEQGCKVMKFFPAETAGGLKHLQSMAAPYHFLGLQFIPLGGCNIGNAPMYLGSPLIHSIGGSWIAPQKLIQAQEWSQIKNNAAEITRVIREVRSSALV
ncbi:2-dehydro-3-deoxyphosphogluconate aldolase/(4S)-4-hydroxy-2-oxoglutarate aldolase [Dyadobacter jejuensis]|uniref:2-dehydro-3-deoxy-phosphogluconate aldolase n=1 Tax=Dyadobacter jejuensis TaxID=1082580 RepID=A0A316AEZ8_9BACT|nr:bifunctional 4-hydroxy-2-oxoglutarate aldolase/2-dehydro-3-deoxy-phosphogluconate aldolase [Dyadobacter jejuensis]PWJ55560.1 2-dehydro-3-deoxyphosphogluconate aldolase/(4S)-4-hydroxy-2-oxoglutarate aldolase [Dyadobacter jejuensis]